MNETLFDAITKESGPREAVPEPGSQKPGLGSRRRKRHLSAGDAIGRLTVIAPRAKKNEKGKYLALCKCSCGTEGYFFHSNIRIGHTESCGCLKRERTTKHGMNPVLWQNPDILHLGEY